MKLIIAEKPSLARNIIQAIGLHRFSKNDGFYSSDDYIVTWAFGHLFGLIDIEEYADDYNPSEKVRWDIKKLPFFPEKFRMDLRKKDGKVDTSVKKQFGIIKKLCNQSNIDAIINAGDSDREGEIIIRTIIEKALKNSKPIYRLWLPDQTEETIRSGLSSLKFDREYNDLANEGYARMYIDWVYGVNLTRYASIKSNTLLRIGRVIVPIVKAVYERDAEIENFVPQKYYQPVSAEQTNGEEILLESREKFDNVSLAQELCKKYNSSVAVVKSVQKERKTIGAGKLFSLSKLQGVLGKKYKMSLSDSLAVVQSLYEKGYVTYPRTNTEYLAEAEKNKIDNILSMLKDKGYMVEFKDRKSIFNDTKIESHSAITPTLKYPDISSLSENESNVYTEILNRFLAVFCSVPCEVDRSTIVIKIGDYEEITLKGDVYVNKGFLMYDNQEVKDKVLPNIAEGDVVNINFVSKEKETAPPKAYTTETLNNYLKNPFKDEKKDADENDEYKAIFEGLELGTEATRSGIIDNALRSKYISLKNNVYHIEPKGKFLIESAKTLGINMDKHKTVELGKALKKVYKGELSIEESVKIAEREVSEVIGKNIDISSLETIAEENQVGICPKCGAAVVERKSGFFCKNNDCKFVLWKNDKYFSSFGKSITTSMAKKLLDKRTVELKGLKSKKGTTFNAIVKVNFADKWPKYTMEFPQKNSGMRR